MHNFHIDMDLYLKLILEKICDPTAGINWYSEFINHCAIKMALCILLEVTIAKQLKQYNLSLSHSNF